MTQVGNFAAVQLTSDDPDRLEREWNVPTLGAEITTSTYTVPNKPLFTFIVFRGCTVNATGDCDLTADLAIFGPDGKLEQEKKGIEIWRGKAPDSASSLFLSQGAIGFGTDDKGPFGEHRVVIKVTDNVARVTLSTEQRLTVAPAK